jgi:predicted GTPase
MPEGIQEKNLMEKVQQEIQRTQEVMGKLSRLNVSKTEQKRIQKLRERLEQLVREYEVLKNAG